MEGYLEATFQYRYASLSAAIIHSEKKWREWCELHAGYVVENGE
jgi:hypothetical protein